MKQICRNCHFFAKETRDPGTGSPFSFSISQQERELVKSGNSDFIADHYCLKCHMGVWDEGLFQDKENRLDRINIVPRKNCFYLRHDPHMLFPAAVELQKRMQENRQLKQSHMYTRIGLWFAAGALLLNALLTYLGKSQ